MSVSDPMPEENDKKYVGMLYCPLIGPAVSMTDEEFVEALMEEMKKTIK